MVDHQYAMCEDPENSLLIGATPKLLENDDASAFFVDDDSVPALPERHSTNGHGVEKEDDDEVASTTSTVESETITLQEDLSQELSRELSMRIDVLKPLADGLQKVASVGPFLGSCCHPRKPPKVVPEGNWHLIELVPQMTDTGNSSDREEDSNREGTEREEDAEFFPEVMKRLGRAVAMEQACRYVKTLIDNTIAQIRIVQEASRNMQRNIELIDLFEMIGLPRPHLLVLEFKEYGCHTIDDLTRMDQSLWKERLRMYSGHRKMLADAVERCKKGNLFWHYQLPTSKQLAGSITSGCRSSEGSFHPAGTITMAARISKRIDSLSVGDRVLSLNQGKLVNVKVRRLHRDNWVQQKMYSWLDQPMPTYYCIDLRLLQGSSMEAFEIRAAGSLPLWRVNGEKSGWACIGKGLSEDGPPLQKGDILVRFDGSAAVIVNIKKHNTDKQSARDSFFLEVGGQGTMFVDGFLARSNA